MSIQPVIDHEILKERLITKEGQHLTAMRGSLSKCAMKLLEFSRAVQETCSLNNQQKSVDSLTKIASELVREIKLHDLEMKKMALGAQAMQAEISHYDAISEKTRSSIINTKQEIEKLKLDLDRETKIRRNRQEYDELAKMTSERAPSRISKRKLMEENEEIETIRMEQEKIKKKLAMKGKQFHLLMQMIEDLKRDVDGDDENDDEDNVTSQPII